MQAAAQSVGIEVGKVLAVDREAQLLLLSDRSAWSLAAVRKEMLSQLTAGDRVQFGYRTPDDGPAAVIEFEITHHASKTAATEVAEDIVLAFDRRA